LGNCLRNCSASHFDPRFSWEWGMHCTILLFMVERWCRNNYTEYFQVSVYGDPLQNLDRFLLGSSTSQAHHSSLFLRLRLLIHYLFQIIGHTIRVLFCHVSRMVISIPIQRKRLDRSTKQPGQQKNVTNATNYVIQILWQHDMFEKVVVISAPLINNWGKP